MTETTVRKMPINTPKNAAARTSGITHHPLIARPPRPPGVAGVVATAASLIAMNLGRRRPDNDRGAHAPRLRSHQDSRAPAAVRDPIAAAQAGDGPGVGGPWPPGPRCGRLGAGRRLDVPIHHHRPRRGRSWDADGPLRPERAS